jgi:hypothetical protein
MKVKKSSLEKDRLIHLTSTIFPTEKKTVKSVVKCFELKIIY